MKRNVVINIDEKFNINKFYNKLKYYRIFSKNKHFELNYIIQIPKDIKDELEEIVTILNIKNKRKRLEHIFDLACRKIDKLYISKNFCEFENNQCLAQKGEKDKCNGCCGKCQFLINKKCSQKSISCKLYFCNKIRKKKKCPTINKIPYLKYFLNMKEKIIFRTSIYQNKNEMINNILKKCFIIYLLEPVKKPKN